MHRRTRLLTAVLTSAVVAAVSTGCSDTSPRSDGSQPDTAEASAVEQLGHVHGLGVDPADDALYVASHFGVFRYTGSVDGTDDAAGVGFTRVADRWQDTMGFTVAGPGRFLASGHPDMREELPVHLGLIESVDGARTWREVSRQGEADFHALDVVGVYVYGYNSLTQKLLASTNGGRRWEPVVTGAFVDVAANPAEPEAVLATTANARLVQVTYDGDGGATDPVPAAPPLLFLDYADETVLVGLAPDATAYVSRDRGHSWEPTAGLRGQPHAVDATPTAWHAATSAGVFRSDDQGRTWSPLTR